VKNVHFKATPQELKDHFKECGEINRITIPVDQSTNKSKGYRCLLRITFNRFAYIEFETNHGAMVAKQFNESLFHGRQITVIPKRKNIPGQGAFKGKSHQQ